MQKIQINDKNRFVCVWKDESDDQTLVMSILQKKLFNKFLYKLLVSNHIDGTFILLHGFC